MCRNQRKKFTLVALNGGFTLCITCGKIHNVLLEVMCVFLGVENVLIRDEICNITVRFCCTK